MNTEISKEQQKTILLSSLGGMLEYYDFTIFAVFSIIIGQTFFPSNSRALSTLVAFTVFAVGYLIRPLGGALFSHFGDKYGRKKPFLLSIIIMASATFLMGILPSYHSMGAIGPLIFITLRIMQGLAVGAEIPGAIVFSIEHAGKKGAGRAGGTIMMLLFAGAILSNVLYFSLYSTLSHAAFYQYGWRIAFVLGGFFGIFGFFLRLKLSESPEFLKENYAIHKTPIIALFKTHFFYTIAGFFLIAVQATIASIFFLYMPSYMQLSSHISNSSILLLSIISLIVYSFSCFMWGAASDKFGQKKIFLIGLALLAPVSFMAYFSIIHHFFPIIFCLIAAVAMGAIGGTYCTMLAETFPTKIRFSGVAVSLNMSVGIFGGCMPLLSTFIIHDVNFIFIPFWIICGAGILGFAGFLTLEKLQEVALQ